jgi:hypothetical protein
VLLVVLVLVVLAASVVIAVNGLGPFGSPVVCLTEGPDGNYVLGNCPPTVIPPQESDSATLTIEVPNAFPGWIEGGYFYMRATTADGQVVMNQQMDYRWEGSGGPAASGVQPPLPTAFGEAHLPPGSYSVTFYGRSCGGFCGFLDPPSFECTFSITVAANERIQADYDWSVPTCGVSAGT